MAPVHSCFPKVMMLFWCGGGEWARDSPVPTSSPQAVPSCIAHKGTGSGV